MMFRKPDAGMEHSTGKRRILLVDDHSVVRDGISLWVNGSGDMEVCGVAEQTGLALELVERLAPDAVITDIGMPGRDGLELVKDIRARWPMLPVLIFTVHDEALYAGRALRAGARGYCSKGSGAEVLLEALRAVLAGRLAFSAESTNRLLEAAAGRQASAGNLSALSDREFEIFRLFGAGRTNQEIAELLHLSTKTVETHSLNIRRKLSLKSPAQLIRHAVHRCSVEADGLRGELG
jgi:DNA-binding NarL/FixJ family response regulator